MLRAGSHVENTTKDRKERIGRILQMHANHREDMDAAFTGDIVAIVGLKHSSTGDTLCDPANPIVLESISFPTPVISVAVEPKTKADQDKLGTGLAKLADEDPTFVVKYDDETGQTVISGMGELHLDIIVDRLRREFSVDANVGKPQVAYRETIRKPVHKVEGRFIRQTRRARAVRSRRTSTSSPPATAAATSSSTRSSGGKIPREYIPAVDQGIQEAMENGVLAGYPLVDVRATLMDGSYHEVDSSEMAFKIAGSIGAQGGRPQGRPRAARARDGVRGDHARGLHGRGHGRRHRAPRTHRAHRRPRAVRRRSACWSRSPSCSATRPTCVRAPRGARRTARCSCTHYHEVPAQIAKEIVARVRGE